MAARPVAFAYNFAMAKRVQFLDYEEFTLVQRLDLKDGRSWWEIEAWNGGDSKVVMEKPTLDDAKQWVQGRWRELAGEFERIVYDATLKLCEPLKIEVRHSRGKAPETLTVVVQADDHRDDVCTLMLLNGGSTDQQLEQLNERIRDVFTQPPFRLDNPWEQLKGMSGALYRVERRC